MQNYKKYNNIKLGIGISKGVITFILIVLFVASGLSKDLLNFISSFYKLTPIDNEELVKRINILAEQAGIKLKSVFRFDMSKNTKKANAAFTGIGKSKRILLGDTLIDNFSYDEVETILAHEMGHYKKKHIIKNIIIGTISSFLTLFLIAWFYENSLNWLGFNNRTDIAALPLLSVWGMLIGVILTPIGNIISRKYEYEADRYSVSETNKPEAFITALRRLTEQNLGDKDPHPFVEWFFYSHPAVKRRITAIADFSGITEISNDEPVTEGI